MGSQHEVVVVAFPELEHPGVSTDDDLASYAPPETCSTPGTALCREVGGHLLPVEATEGRRRSRPPSAVRRSTLRRRARSSRGDSRKTSWQARLNWRSCRSRRRKRSRDGQVRVVEQPAGEMHPRRASQPVGVTPTRVTEEPAQVPGRDTAAARPVGLSSQVEAPSRIRLTARQPAPVRSMKVNCGHRYATAMARP